MHIHFSSLVVVANYFHATLEGEAADAFVAGGAADAIAGLRRLRAHAHGQAKREKVQKPVHPHWVPWVVCQRVRRHASRVFWAGWDSTEGETLRALYASLEAARRQQRQRGGTEREDTTALALRVARNGLFQSLQELVFLYIHTITPPVRVSIARLLQFRTTLVKRRNDPKR